MAKLSRRNFVSSAGASGLAAQTRTAAGFQPQGAPRRLSENLWVFEDTCNVYIVRNGAECVLIDFGSGKALDHLAPLGITKVAWILHTHHHRDQCQGDHQAARRGIPIAVPAHERHLFADAENFWRNRRIFHLYYVRNDFNTLTRNVPVARPLADYSVFKWGPVEFFVFPTPGHTLGSITLLATIDGRKTAFTGDLLYAPGKILNLYDTQVNYGGSEGIDLGIYSLTKLGEQKPELLCPSHGEPMRDPDDAIRQTIARLRDYYAFQTGVRPTIDYRPFAVSRHLVCAHETNSTFYAIISDSGKALFLDYGSASGLHFSNFERATPVVDRIRFVEHNLDFLRSEFGMKSIDIAMPSHMHDDHLNGFPYLIRHHGTKIWCYENMKDICEKPRLRNLGCTLGEPFPVARTFRHGEKFRWEEFEFEVAHSPGHTEYQMALYVTLDGQRVAFTGDAFFPNPRNDGTMRHNIIFRNHVENDSHLKSIRSLIEHEPQLLCPGHGRPFPVDRPLMEATLDKFLKQQKFFFDLLPEGEVDYGLDPSWVRIEPYQMTLTPGANSEAVIVVRNYGRSPMKAEVALVAPGEWSVRPDVARIDVPAGREAGARVNISIPKSWQPPAPRIAIAADVVRDGKYVGQVTEAVADFI
jgi:glyoxylase-like metal-dependent hydrolase (beta-lactamase superfamily II)